MPSSLVPPPFFLLWSSFQCRRLRSRLKLSMFRSWQSSSLHWFSFYSRPPDPPRWAALLTLWAIFSCRVSIGPRFSFSQFHPLVRSLDGPVREHNVQGHDSGNTTPRIKYPEAGSFLLLHVSAHYRQVLVFCGWYCINARFVAYQTRVYCVSSSAAV